MIKSTSVHIGIDDINIKGNFKRDLPKKDKIAARYSFYKKTGGFDREILIDENNNLIDGYTTYLICKMVGIEKVRALRIKVSFTLMEHLDMAVAKLEAEYGKRKAAD